MVTELASLELMFHLAKKEDFAWDQISDVMRQRNVKLPATLHSLDICDLSLKNIYNAVNNIYGARAEFLELMGEYFQPADNQLLYE